MKTKSPIIIAILALIALLCFQIGQRERLTLDGANSPPTRPQVARINSISSDYPYPSSKQLAGSTPGIIADREVTRENSIMNVLLATPITFYGKVVDEKGIPVGNAKAAASFADHAFEGDSVREAESDLNGNFHFYGHGMGVSINVSKSGYYRTKQSRGSFGYANFGAQTDIHTNPNSPAVFVLQKIGKLEPLVVKGLGGGLPKDGTPIEIDLNSGLRVATGQGDVKIECWTVDQGIGTNSNQHFDWRCRVSVEGGGLAERTGEFDFLAPENGYANSDLIDMPKSSPMSWRTSVKKEYFLHLKNGSYARIRLMINAGGDQIFALTSYLNPNLGHRNLEYNPETH